MYIYRSVAEDALAFAISSLSLSLLHLLHIHKIRAADAIFTNSLWEGMRARCTLFCNVVLERVVAPCSPCSAARSPARMHLLLQFGGIALHMHVATLRG